MKRSLKSVFLTEDTKLTRHYGNVLDMLVGNPHYADEAKNDILLRVVPSHRGHAERIIGLMKKFAVTDDKAHRERLAGEILRSLEKLPVREGKSRPTDLLVETPLQSFSLGFKGDRSGYGGPPLTGMGSVADQRWPTVSSPAVSEALTKERWVAIDDLTMNVVDLVSGLEALADEMTSEGDTGGASIVLNMVRTAQKMAAELDRLTRR